MFISLPPLLTATFSLPPHSAHAVRSAALALPTSPAVSAALLASCSGTLSSHPGWAIYTAHIPVTFNHGSGCADIQNHLAGLIGAAPSNLCGSGGAGPRGARSVCNYKCESVGGGEGTYLEFEVPKGHAGHVNQALKDMYPMVELWVSCPDV